MFDYDSRWNEGGPEDTEAYREFVRTEEDAEASRILAQIDTVDMTEADAYYASPEAGFKVTVNKWMDEQRLEQVGHLSDGTPLYPAYYPLRIGERHRRRMGSWSGAEGEHVAVTEAGQLYCQYKPWGGSEPIPGRWNRFTTR